VHGHGPVADVYDLIFASIAMRALGEAGWCANVPALACEAMRADGKLRMVARGAACALCSA
jgi:hypothetical protein